MELRFAFLLNIRRDRYVVDAENNKKFTGGFDYPLPVDCNWSFRQFGEVICSPYPWGLHDEVEFKYYDGGNRWVAVTNDEELATMFAKHKEKEKFHVRLQNDVVVPAIGPSMADASSRAASCRGARSSSQRSSGSARGRGASSGVGSSSRRRVPVEVEEPSSYADEEERLYPDVLRNLRRASRAGNNEADAVVVDEDNEALSDVEDDVPPVEWDRENPLMEQGSIYSSMNECRNALVTYCIKAERYFKVDKSDKVRYRVHCPTEGCQWRMHASKMRKSTNIQVKVNPFSHTCKESTLRKETISRAKSRWVAEEVKKWVTEDNQIGTKELMKNIKQKFKIDLPYMRVFNGRNQALDSIYGDWQESFELLYSFKAEVERTSPGSIVEIDHHTVEYKIKGVTRTKECFRRVFVCFEACRQGFLVGCRPYLAVDATFLTGRFKGQLVAACAVDAHSFVFPVSYGVLETESEESWTWFFQNLHRAIGHPNGLVIHTDACKGLEVAVDNVFPGVEHRECMRHLAANFAKKFKGKVYSDNLWPAALTCSVKKHNYHMRQLYKNEKVKEYLETHHSKLWARSQFSELSKVDYVHNNLAESFNSTIRKLKGLYMVDLLDKIRIEYMEKFHFRANIAAAKFMGHIVIPAVLNELKQKTEGLDMSMKLCSATKAEVAFMDKEKREWKYPVDLESRTCSCRQWQITGLPCIHALFFITTLSGPAGNIQQYVHEYYSVARFKDTYAVPLPTLEGKHQWDVVNPGFKLRAPVLKRAKGRPRKSRIRARSEGAGLGARKRKCNRCGGSGHFGRYCDHAVDPAFGERLDETDDDEQQVGIEQEHEHDDDDDDDDDEQPVGTEHDNVAPNDDDNVAPTDGDQNGPSDFAYEAPYDGSNDFPFDQMDHDHQNEAPTDVDNEAPTDGDNVAPNEAPTDGSQHSVIVSSARYVNLANTSTFIT